MENITKLFQQTPISIVGKSILISVIIEAIVIISLEAVLASFFLSISSSLEGTPAKGIPVYLILFLISQLFQILLVVDAVFHQNTIQIIGFVVFNGCCFAYSVFQHNQLSQVASSQLEQKINYQKLSPYLISIIVIIGFFQIIYFFLAYKLYQEFGWKIYKKIGADPEMRNMYRFYQIFLMILKMDIFFFLTFSIQFLVLVLNTSDPEFALTILALPITLFVLTLAVYGLKRENSVLMSAFIFGCLMAVAYFIFKLARMYDKTQEYKYVYTRNLLTFFASLSLIAVIGTLINSIICFLNFGKGLKQHILDSVDATNNNEMGNRDSKQDRKVNLNE